MINSDNDENNVSAISTAVGHGICYSLFIVGNYETTNNMNIFSLFLGKRTRSLKMDSTTVDDSNISPMRKRRKKGKTPRKTPIRTSIQ